MRRMYSESELRTFIKKYIRESGDDVVASLVGKDINVGDLAVTGDATISGDVVAKTLEQTQPNYIFDFSSLIKPSDETNFEKVGTPFAKMSVINGVLHIVCIIAFHNKDTANAHNLSLLQLNLSNIPSEIGSKIYDVGGKNLTEAITPGLNRIRWIPCSMESNTNNPIRMNHQAPNTIQLYQPQYVSIPADENGVISFECNLIII